MKIKLNDIKLNESGDNITYAIINEVKDVIYEVERSYNRINMDIEDVQEAIEGGMHLYSFLNHMNIISVEKEHYGKYYYEISLKFSELADKICIIGLSYTPFTNTSLDIINTKIGTKCYLALWEDKHEN